VSGVHTQLVVVERVDFSQFYVVSGDRFVNMLNPEYPEMELGLYAGVSLGAMMFVAFRQHGDIEVLVELHDEQPPPLEAAWQDVVEVPFYPVGETRLKGWDPSEKGTVIGLAEQTEYRVRYSIADADAAWSDPDGDRHPLPERYRLQFWPEPGRLPEVVVQESAAGQYWGFSYEANTLVPQFLEGKESAEGRPLTDDEKLLAVVDGAIEAHPLTAKRISAGEHRFTVGIHAFVQRLMMAAYDRPAVESLIVERASREVQG
jgi:hypothetical protein